MRLGVQALDHQTASLRLSRPRRVRGEPSPHLVLQLLTGGRVKMLINVSPLTLSLSSKPSMRVSGNRGDSWTAVHETGGKGRGGRRQGTLIPEPYTGSCTPSGLKLGTFTLNPKPSPGGPPSLSPSLPVVERWTSLRGARSASTHIGWQVNTTTNSKDVGLCSMITCATGTG